MRLMLFSLFILMFSMSALASPMAPQPELDIEGVIAEIEWVPEITEKGIWGMSGTLGGDRTFPAHYVIDLIDCEISLAEGQEDFPPEFLRPGTLGKQAKYSFTLNHPADDGYLGKGMRIKVMGYQVSGDEGGVWTRFRSVGKIAVSTDTTGTCGNCDTCDNRDTCIDALETENASTTAESDEVSDGR